MRMVDTQRSLGRAGLGTPGVPHCTLTNCTHALHAHRGSQPAPDDDWAVSDKFCCERVCVTDKLVGKVGGAAKVRASAASEPGCTQRRCFHVGRGTQRSRAPWGVCRVWRTRRGALAALTKAAAPSTSV